MKTVTLRFITACAIAAIAGFGLGPFARASSALPGAQALTNPLIMTNPLTGARAQMMPTTSWLSQHGIPYGQGSSSNASSGTSSASGALPATCTLGTDNSAGDAQPLVNSSAAQVDALDLTGFGLSTSSDGANLTGQISVQSLNDGAGGTPAFVGGGDVWFINFNLGANSYFLEARYPASPADTGYTNGANTSSLPVDLIYGHVAPGTGGISQHYLDGTATGSFDTTNNLITMTAPLSAFG